MSREKKKRDAEEEVEIKRAEEQAKGMRQDDERREREAAALKKEKNAAEQEKINTKMAVQVREVCKIWIQGWDMKRERFVRQRENCFQAIQDQH